MRRLGKTILISHTGNLILRGKIVPRIGEDVFDSQLTRVGVVNDVFGPVIRPFISVSPEQDDPEILLDKPVYLMGSGKQSSRKVY